MSKQIFQDACILSERLNEVLSDRIHPISTAFMAAALLARDLDYSYQDCQIMFKSIMSDLNRIPAN